MAEKKTLSAKEVVEDLRAGATDEFLMKKYGVSEKGLQSLFQKLVKAKVLTQGDLDRRTKISRDASLPVFKFLCPACKTPHQEEYPVCPQCGVIVEKYREKQAREQAEKDRELQASLEQQNQSHQIQETSAPEQAKIPSYPGQAAADCQNSETADKLAKLQAALHAGLLSQSEFEQKRDPLLVQTLSSELRTKLEQLRELGLISPEEFEAKQMAIEERAAKVGQLREALELGILNREEFDRKIREILPERPPSDTLVDNLQPRILVGPPVQETLSFGSGPASNREVASESSVEAVLDKIARGGTHRAERNADTLTASDETHLIIHYSRLKLAGLTLIMFVCLLFFIFCDVKPVGFLHLLPASVWEALVSIIILCLALGVLLAFFRIVSAKPAIRATLDGIYCVDGSGIRRRKHFIKWTDIKDVIYTVKQEDVWSPYGQTKTRSKVLRIITSENGKEEIIDIPTGLLKGPADGWESTALKLKAMNPKYAMT